MPCSRTGRVAVYGRGWCCPLPVAGLMIMARRARRARDMRRRRSCSASRSSSSVWMNSSLNIGCIAVSSRVAVSGLTSCRQPARHAVRLSVTGPTPPLSARGHHMTPEATRYCRPLDGYELRQCMHLAGARPERRHPGVLPRRVRPRPVRKRHQRPGRLPPEHQSLGWPAKANAAASPVTPRNLRSGRNPPSRTVVTVAQRLISDTCGPDFLPERSKRLRDDRRQGRKRERACRRVHGHPHRSIVSPAGVHSAWAGTGGPGRSWSGPGRTR
jgi:hypothetical protein